MGTIDDPTEGEWREASIANLRPYRWHEGTRIIPQGSAAPQVIRAIDGPRCKCSSQRSLPPSSGYERIPDGIWEHSEILSDEEKAQLHEIAKFVGRSDLCTRSLPLLARSIEVDTGVRPCKAMYTIINRIEEFDSVGLHCSPPVVAWIIREFAAWSLPNTWQRYKAEGLCTHCGRARRGRTLKCDLCREIELAGRRLRSLRSRRKHRNLSIPARTIR
jgi:hypothetical protein